MMDNPAKTKGSWAWLLQRVTAVLMIVFLGLHIWLVHFENLDEELLSWENVESRVQSFVILFVDYGLLITVLYHALGGVRMVAFDFVLRKGYRKTIDAGLWIVGIISSIWGIIIFAPFLGWA